MKKIYLILSCLCFYITNSSMAQINIGGSPKSFQLSLPANLAQAMVMPSLDMSAIVQEDREDKVAGRPPRFGFPLAANFNLDNAGAWETLPNNEGKVWRLKIACPGARSINLLYDDFWLPEGATLYIYNQDKSHVIGGFTSKNNNSPRGESIGYATGLVFGEMITLEYFEPLEVEQTGRLSIAYVVHGYKTIDISDTDSRAFGDSGNCQFNINCPAGDGWELDGSSVALILVGGTRWCTGSLLNTTMGDFLPYFLTAHHCLDGWAVPTALDAVSNPNGSTWSFYWNYESPTCTNPLTEPGFTSTTGAILVANKSDSDFALFRLTEDPYTDAGLILNYNGWDAGESPPAGGAGIHHPSGDIKKISLFQQTPTSNHSCSPSNTWSVIFQHSAGVFSTTEGGSSGSPLFDNNHRVIGQLWGGTNPTNCGGGPTCSNPANDLSYYGKFSVSWDDAGGIQRRLRDWLAPTCHFDFAVPSNTTIGAPVYYASNQLSSNQAISGTVTDVVFNGGDAVVLTEGFSVSGGAVFRATNYSCASTLVTNELEETLPGRGSIVVPTEHGTKLYAGDGKLISEELRVENRTNITPTRTFSENILTCQPNPFKGSTTLLFKLEQAGQVQLQLYDLRGTLLRNLVNTTYPTAGDYTYELESNTLAAGQYWAVLQTAKTREVVKLVLIK